MASLNENNGVYNWEEGGVRQLEETDLVQGGAEGASNLQAAALATRTRNLHNRLEVIEDSYAPAASPAFTGTPTAPAPTAESPDGQIATIGYVNETAAEILNSLPATYTPTDGSVTKDKLHNSLKAINAMAGVAIDWAAGTELTKTLTANTTFTESNLTAQKVIVLWLTGNYSISWPAAYYKKEKGSENYDGTVMNKVVMHCKNATAGSQEVWYYITQIAV